MNWLRELLNQSQVVLLGWTLVHFLWQGALLAVLLAVVLKAMKGCSSQARYVAACVAMVALLFCPVLTLETFAPEFVRRMTASGGDAAPAVTLNWLLQSLGRLLDSPLAGQLLRAMVGAWGFGVAFLLARLLLGWLRVQQVRRAARPVNCMPIQGRMSVMALRIGIKKPVRLMESALAQGPAVVGFLRPMILLPTAAITGLWPVQIEAILAHELAHIRRHDYLVNLLQSFVETLLFYHPAVWWVSARIREERENCCDDLAVKACGDRTFYAGCLADLDDLRPSAMELAMGASGGALLWRIRRILLLPDRETRTVVPVAAVLAMLMSSGLLFAGLARTRTVAQASTAQVFDPPSEPFLNPQKPIAPEEVAVVPDDATRNLPVSEPSVAPSVTLAPNIRFPQVSPAVVWTAGQWLQRHWPAPAVVYMPENVGQAAEKHQAPKPHDQELEKSDFPSVPSMPPAGRSSADGDAASPQVNGPEDSQFDDVASIMGELGGSAPDFPISAVSLAPLNTTVGAPLVTITAKPFNTVGRAPLNAVTGGPLNTVTGGPLMTVRGGPIMVTTGNPMVNRGPNYPQLVPRGPEMTVQARQSP